MRSSSACLLILPVMLVMFAGVACGPPVDLVKGLQVVDVSSGWLDAGIVGGKNKLVPSISFKLKNVSNQTLRMLQVNAKFVRASGPDDWGDNADFKTAAGSGGLAPDATTGELTMKPRFGYAGTDPREDLLHNSHFVDAKVELAAKYGSAQMRKIAEYPISRRLITQ